MADPELFVITEFQCMKKLRAKLSNKKAARKMMMKLATLAMVMKTNIYDEKKIALTGQSFILIMNRQF